MIYTGYFDQLEKYRYHRLTPVCIAGYAPRGYTGICYKQLAPKKIWWQEWHDKQLGNQWYEQKYQETILNLLSPEKVATDMHSFGTDVVMLCYERPSDFCHRHLVAKWLTNHHIPVQEFNLSLSRD